VDGARRFVLPDEAGARRPIFFATPPIRRTLISFERILYPNLVETADRHCHLQSIAASAFTC
jgi:hypothetical protein